ncbi:glycosyltransferase [Priestia flexa]|uniref:glycosyltransferase n=1 Tax=Priestia flexa TaxID=86664 RepID=UPI00077C9F52|nr:glycosyltransferase [Priestia flexa]MED4590146.1 glycosyltransferase [Priestia flexa]
MKKIIFISHTFIGGPFVVGSHHLARTFSENGHQVIHISTPFTPLHYFKKNEVNRMKKERVGKVLQLNDNLIDYIPFTFSPPWSILKYLYGITNKNLFMSLAKNNIQKVVAKFFGSLDVDYLIIDQPTMVGIEEMFNVEKIIYRPTDLYADMLNDSSIINAEKKIINKANGLIATSKPVLDHIRSFDDSLPYMLVENGVDFKHFAEPQLKPEFYETLEGIKAVYAGAIDDRLDLESIVKLAKENFNINVIVIGPIEDYEILQRYSNLKNLHFLGPIKYKELPAYLQHSDIALLPLSNHKANNGRSPMKLYEYLATGLPVVTKKTEELLHRNEEYVFFYEDISIEVRKLISMQLLKEQVKAGVEKYSWNSKADNIINFISDL